MKHAVVMMVLSAFLGAVPGLAASGDKGGNGGGGLVRNGQVLTFGSAGMHINVGLKALTTVPGAVELARVIFGLKITATQKAQILEQVVSDPNGERRYFQIDESDLDPAKRAEFLKDYQEAIAEEVPLDQLAVFAATSREKHETYLLPEFFRLKLVEQEAILFHEALWVLMPAGTPYSFVMDAEVKMQNYITAGATGYDPDLYAVLDDVLKDHMISLKVGLAEDVASGALKAFYIVSPNCPHCLDVMALFGPFEQLAQQTDEQWRQQLTFNLLTKLTAHPDSKALRRLYELRARLIFHAALHIDWTDPYTLDPEIYYHGGHKDYATDRPDAAFTDTYLDLDQLARSSLPRRIDLQSELSGMSANPNDVKTWGGQRTITVGD